MDVDYENGLREKIGGFGQAKLIEQLAINEINALIAEDIKFDNFFSISIRNMYTATYIAHGR